MWQFSADEAMKKQPASKPRLTKKGNEHKDKIIDSCLEVVAARGLDRIDVLAVCRQAGIKRTLFYHYFSGINEVVDEASAKLGRNLVELFEGKNGATPRGIHRFELCLSTIIQKAKSEPAWGKSILALSSRLKLSENFYREGRLELEAAIEKEEVNIPVDKIDDVLFIYESLLVNTLRNNSDTGSDGSSAISYLLEQNKLSQKIKAPKG